MPNIDNNDTSVIWSFLINAYADVYFAIVPTSVNPPVSPPITTNANDESTLTIMEQTLAEQPPVTPKLKRSFFPINNLLSPAVTLLSPKFQPYYMGKLAAEDIIRKIASDYLSPADIVKFALASGSNWRLLQPEVQSAKLAMLVLSVAYGEQDNADELLKELSPESKAKSLLQASAFTDYSGRTFNCTAYEYAYWAKDTHMCRMLEAHMDADTKAKMLERIDAIERDGLTYKQHGLAAKASKHFDMAPLITAYTQYIEAYNNWAEGINAAGPMGGLRGTGARGHARFDLAAISHLDEIRTAELTQLRENLSGADPEPVRGPRP